MAQSMSEAAPELARFDESEARTPMSGGMGAAVGAAPGMQSERPVMRPSREVELTLARLDWRLVAIHEMDPQAVSQFTRLAISLISGSARRTLKRVLLTSAHSGEGRSCVALNLAAALARSRQRALVIDTDLRRPSIGRLLGLESEIGLAEAVALGLRPEEAIIRILPADFHVMLTRGQVDNSAELLVSPNFKRLLSELDACYDFILFDSAPMLKSADASLLGLLTSATILVTRPGATSTEEMRKSVSLLNEETFFGVVMNQVDDWG
ncbi:MAG TPA: CpsD/CapB family tyrosine-protein kinase [Blastocatellia bacterium]|nr:CpsD/CapB family tyrosine-protein kinase [Blastocatellia bacterium]